MKYSIKELKRLLMYAQEEDNQSLINSCAQDIARIMCDIDHNLDYDQVLCQYGYSNKK